MSKADVEAIYKKILKLTHNEKIDLLRALQHGDHEAMATSYSSRLTMEFSRHMERDQKVSFYGIKGVGKEIWEGIDAQEYVNKEREAWDKKDT